MEKSFFLLAIFTISFPVFGQNESKTLFGGAGEKPQIGFYLSPAYQLMSATGQAVHNLSGHAGIVINRRFTIGGSFFRSMNEFTPATEANKDLYLDLVYGGLRTEYILRPHKLLSFSFPLMAGVGEASMDYRDGANDILQGTDAFGEAYFFFAEPGANAEINLVKHVRFTIGGSYRLVSGLDYTYRGDGSVTNQIDSQDLSGFNLNVGLRLGIF